MASHPDISLFVGREITGTALGCIGATTNRHFGNDADAVTAELLKRGWIIIGKGSDLKECMAGRDTANMILMINYGVTEVTLLLKARKLRTSARVRSLARLGRSSFIRAKSLSSSGYSTIAMTLPTKTSSR
jgi:hypothetical protein